MCRRQPRHTECAYYHGPPVVLTDLLILPALAALYLCYRLRRRRGWVDLLPLPTLGLVLVAAYFAWYVHRPQPGPVREELAPA